MTGQQLRPGGFAEVPEHYADVPISDVVREWARRISDHPAFVTPGRATTLTTVMLLRMLRGRPQPDELARHPKCSTRELDGVGRVHAGYGFAPAARVSPTRWLDTPRLRMPQL